MLRDGEKKIVNALKSGPKHFKDLSKKVGPKKNPKGILNPSILSKYLKNLQHEGMIEQDIDSKIYKLNPISYARLLFNDISDFMEEYLNTTTNEKVKESIDIYSPSFQDETVGVSSFILIEPKHEIREKILQILHMDSKINRELEKTKEKLDEVWDSFVLTANQRKIITKYQQFLSEYYEKTNLIMTKSQKEEIQNKQFKMMKILARDELEEEFPDVDIPEKMIQIRAQKKFDDLKSKGRIRQYNLEHLELMVKGLMRNDFVRDNFTEQEKKELEEIENFLTNPKNRKLYESYLERRSEHRPKTVLIYPIWGFDPSIERLAQLFPKDIETYPNYKTYLKTKKGVK